MPNQGKQNQIPEKNYLEKEIKMAKGQGPIMAVDQKEDNKNLNTLLDLRLD